MNFVTRMWGRASQVCSLGARNSSFWLNHLAFLAGVGIFLPTSASGEGFRNPPPGAFNLGRAGGRIAHVDDSSAALQNPANLVDLTRPEVQFSPSVVYIHVDYESPAGAEAETKNPWKLLPNLFGSLPLADGKCAVGLAVTAPYGLSNEWEEDGAFADPTSLRYTAPHFAELKSLLVNPAFSIRLGEHFQAGVALDVMWSQLTFEQFYPWFIFPGSTGTEPDGVAKAKGDGWGFGGNVGLTWQIAPRHRLAATCRTPISVDYEGYFEVGGITPTAAALGAQSRSDFRTRANFPTRVAVGYGWRVTDRVRLEANVEWLQFSRFQSLDLDVDENAFLLGSTSLKQDWNDTFTAGLAGDWQFAPNWTLRAGYQFYQTPVPEKTFSPTIPDADQNVLTLGLSYRYRRHSLELAYGLDFYDHRRIENNQTPAFNGDYDITVHMVALAYRLSF